MKVHTERPGIEPEIHSRTSDDHSSHWAGTGFNPGQLCQSTINR